MLHPQSVAPNFELLDQNGKKHTLEEYRGQPVLLYFYPKDGTPGCTKEACSLRDNFHQFENLNVKVIGLNADSVASHQKFAEKYNLPFTLLSDISKTTIKAYKANGLLITKRISYLIDKNGIIIKSLPKVDPTTHTAEMLDEIKNLK